MKTSDEIDVLECRLRGMENENRALRATLRDQFASAALAGFCAKGWQPLELMTEKCFEVAELMLEARKK